MDTREEFGNSPKTNIQNQGAVVVIGGMDRMESLYVEEAESRGIDLKVFLKPAPDLVSRIQNAGALIFLSSRVSHRARREMMKAARSRKIPVLNCRSCGICMFRDCLECLAGRRSEAASGSQARGNCNPESKMMNL